MITEDTTIKQDLCVNCGSDSGNKVVCYCPECNMSLCDICDKIFHRRGSFKLHKREYSLDKERVPRKTRCNNHPNVPLTLYCRDDKSFICVLCYSRGGHKGHNVEAYEDISAHITGEMEPLIQEVKTAVEESQTTIKRLRDELENLFKNYMESQETLYSFEDTATNAIESSEGTLMTKSATFANETEHEIDSRTEALYKITTKIRALLDRSKECGDNNRFTPRTMERVLWIQSKATDLLAKSKEALSKPPLKFIEFAPYDVPTYDSLSLIEEKYLCGGFPCPTNLKVLNTTDFSVLLEWTAVPIEFVESLNVAVSYHIEQRCHGDTKFDVVSRTSDASTTVSNLESSTLYEFRVCAVCQKAKSAYTPILFVKTLSISSPPTFSTILRELDPRVVHFLYGWCESSRFRLIYRGSRDGFTSLSFHSKCDSTKNPTLTVILNASGAVFGGFATMPWGAGPGPISAPGSFLFSLKSKCETAPTMFPVAETECAMQGRHECGPVFGRGPDLCLVPPFNNRCLSYSRLESSRHSYVDTLGLGPAVFSDVGKDTSFKVKEIEVFEVFK